jgi:hypothetical protein
MNSDELTKEVLEIFDPCKGLSEHAKHKMQRGVYDGNIPLFDDNSWMRKRKGKTKMKKNKQAAYLKKRGITREAWLAKLYTAKLREVNRLRAALKTFIAKVDAIPSAKEEEIRSRKAG